MQAAHVCAPPVPWWGAGLTWPYLPPCSCGLTAPCPQHPRAPFVTWTNICGGDPQVFTVNTEGGYSQTFAASACA